MTVCCPPNYLDCLTEVLSLIRLKTVASNNVHVHWNDGIIAEYDSPFKQRERQRAPVERDIDRDTETDRERQTERGLQKEPHGDMVSGALLLLNELNSSAIETINYNYSIVKRYKPLQKHINGRRTDSVKYKDKQNRPTNILIHKCLHRSRRRRRESAGKPNSH